jgi:hypothetical protein
MESKTCMQYVVAGPRSGMWCARLYMMAVVCATLYAAGAEAGDEAAERWPQVWINPGIYSYHFDKDKDLRNNNVGFGAEVMLANEHALTVGSIINSNNARTHYAGYEWRPLHWKYSGVDVGAGILVGAFDGYPNYHDGGWFVAPVPMLSIEGRRLGANITIIPTYKDRFDGALAIQVKLRVW